MLDSLEERGNCFFPNANESYKLYKNYWEQQAGLREKMTKSRKPEAGVESRRCFRKEEAYLYQRAESNQTGGEVEKTLS